MFTDIQAPDSSLNVRYGRAEKQNGGKDEASKMEIYENKDRNTYLGSHKAGK